jgi:hypothetical protein
MDILKFLNDNNPIETYIKKTLIKNKHDVDTSYHEIYGKYPFFKKNVLKNIIGEILDREVNNEKISGFWKRIDKTWRLIEKKIQKNGIEADHLNFSGPELPGKWDGPAGPAPARGVYSIPNGQPLEEKPEQYENEQSQETTEKTVEDLQQIYVDLFAEYKQQYSTAQELNTVLMQILTDQGYGDIIGELKLIETK